MKPDPDPWPSNAEMFECIAATVSDDVLSIVEVLQSRRDRDRRQRAETRFTKPNADRSGQA